MSGLLTLASLVNPFIAKSQVYGFSLPLNSICTAFMAIASACVHARVGNVHVVHGGCGKAPAYIAFMVSIPNRE